MNYPETINYLYTKLPIFSKTGGKAIKKGLDNIIHLCQQLNQPQHHFTCIHVAGTNGKGSVSHMLAAILQQAGYHVGLYTSPHIVDFRERIKVNGNMISENFVVSFTQHIMPVIEEIEPSFFEITVAMAFDYFRHSKVDFAIIETGLGGRLDSTNIITPKLSIITNISFDHKDILGDTLEAIALEKAGIIKPQVPVIIGRKDESLHAVFAQASKQVKAKLVYAQQTWEVIQSNSQFSKNECTIKNKHTKQTMLCSTDLLGLYQHENICTVLSAIDELILQGIPINYSHVVEALSHIKQLTGLRGRFDIIQHNPLVIIDVAHNEDGVKQVIAHVKKLNFTQLHIILGMVKDKEVDVVLQYLPQTAHYYFTQAQIPRALQVEQLSEKAAYYKLIGETFTNIVDAYKQALHKANNTDCILVCGSFFTAGELYEYLDSNNLNC